MHFRQATEQDLPQLVKLRWDFRAEDGEVPTMSEEEFQQTFWRQLHNHLEGGAWVFWVAVENEQIVSHIFLQIIESIARPTRLDNRFGYITNVYTKPEYRGQGIGAMLMRCVIEQAAQQDLELLLVWPSETSTNFYKRAGFQFANDVMKLQLRDY